MSGPMTKLPTWRSIMAITLMTARAIARIRAASLIGSFIRKRIAFMELHQPFFVFQIDSCYPDSIVERLPEINKDVATVFIYWKAAPGFSFG